MPDCEVLNSQEDFFAVILQCLYNLVWHRTEARQRFVVGESQKASFVGGIQALLCHLKHFT